VQGFPKKVGVANSKPFAPLQRRSSTDPTISEKCGMLEVEKNGV